MAGPETQIRSDDTSGIARILGDVGSAVRGFYDRGGLAGALGMEPWYKMPPLDIAMGFAGGTGLGQLPPQLARKMLADTLRASRAKQKRQVGPTIYHGSPHKWDWPEAGHELTGEGAAAYGHGIIYGGEAPGIGRTYQHTTSNTATIPGAPTGGSQYTLRGADFPSGRDGHKALDTAGELDMLLYNRKTNPGGEMDAHLTQSIEQRIARWRQENAQTKAGGYSLGGSAHEDMTALVDFYEKHVKGAGAADIIERPKGHLYEMTLSRPAEDFLDWDKPLSEQSEGVRRRVDLEAIGWHHAPEPYADRWVDPSGTMRDADPSGQDIYEGFGRDQVAASAALREAGIPGIKYLDQMSRGPRDNRYQVAGGAQPMAFSVRADAEAHVSKHGGTIRDAGEGTRNYVLFDASSVRSVKRD